MIREFVYLGWWWFRARILGIKKPMQSVIFISDKCNLRCKHCSVYETKNPRTKTLQQIEEELRWCYSEGSRFVDFEGGEVMLWRDGDKDINDILDLTREIGFFSCTITTNAQLPFRGIRADSVWVSMDGVGEYHDNIRGHGAFERLERNIRESGVKHLSVNMVVNTENYESVPQALEYVKASPYIETISFNFHTPFKGTEHLFLDRERRSQVIDTIIRYKRQGYPVMNTVSGLEVMRRPPFKRYCWADNFIFSDGSRDPMCMGNKFDVCDKCGFCMGGEMNAMMRLCPDTIIAGLRLRLKS